jgi:hypothetical protein
MAHASKLSAELASTPGRQKWQLKAYVGAAQGICNCSTYYPDTKQQDVLTCQQASDQVKEETNRSDPDGSPCSRLDQSYGC